MDTITSTSPNSLVVKYSLASIVDSPGSIAAARRELVAVMQMFCVVMEMAPAKQMKVMQDFRKQSAQMNMITEMMSEAIDDVLVDDEAKDETDELTNLVLDEISIDVASQPPKENLSGKIPRMLADLIHGYKRLS